MLIVRDGYGLASWNLNRDDYFGKGGACLGAIDPLLTLYGETVLFLAGHVVPLCNFLCGDAHMLAAEGICQHGHRPVEQSAAVATSPALRLRDQDGQVLLPAHSASTSATPEYVQRLPQGDTRIMRHADPVPYRATRFEKYFPPPKESAGGALVRHVGEALIKTKDVDLPRGIHLKCKTLLGIPTLDCMMPPPPASAKDGDARLSMAPAKPLAPDPHAPKPPSVAACIAMYRAGKPLVWGCPVDTPNRAVDEEVRQRAAGAHSTQ